MNQISLQIRIDGRVQGVGYRMWLKRTAEASGITGWVRNRRDGAVEAVLTGPEQAIEAVVTSARRGPPAAAVADVATRQATAAEKELVPAGGFFVLSDA